MGLFDDLEPKGQQTTGTEGGSGLLNDLEPKKSGLVRRGLGDTGISLLKGAIAVPETAVGLADIATGGAAGKAAEGLGFRPKEAKQILDSYLSPEQQAANRNVAQADGFVDTAKALADNPSVIPHTVAESLPPMLAGGVAGRGISAVAPKLAPWAAGAAGEGTVMAGSAAENIRQQTPDGLLTPEQQLAAAGTGLIGGAVGAGGAKVGQKLGLGDLDTALVEGAKNAGARGLPARLAGGAAVEGALQEMPQSVAEQGLQNYALGKPLGEGVGNAAATGLVTGGAMGAGFGALPAATPKAEDSVQPAPSVDNPSPAPVPRPNPNNGPLSRAANLLPTPAPVLDTQRIDQAAGLTAPPLLDAARIAQQVDLNTSQPDWSAKAPAVDPQKVSQQLFAKAGSPVDWQSAPPVLDTGKLGQPDAQPQEQPAATADGATAPAAAVPSQSATLAPDDTEARTIKARYLSRQGAERARAKLDAADEYKVVQDGNAWRVTGKTAAELLDQPVPADTVSSAEALRRQEAEARQAAKAARLNGDNAEGRRQRSLELQARAQRQQLEGQAVTDSQQQRLDAAASRVQEDQQTQQEQALRDQLAYVENQARASGGWNTHLSKERARLRQALEPFEAAKAPQPATDQMPVKDAAPAAPGAQPAEQAADQKPVKWFGSRKKAEQYIAKNKLGATHAVETRGNKYEVRPVEQQLEQSAPATGKPEPQKSDLPRQQVGPNPDGWVNQNAQTDRDMADRRGITAKIEQLFADGLTARQVIDTMKDELSFVDLTDRAGFINGVRATLGIPSQATSEGKDEFATWKAARDRRKAAQPSPEQPAPSPAAGADSRSAEIDSAAHEAATSPHNDLPEPSQAQIEAGNYKKGHVRVQGLDISIENPRGSERRGMRPDGTEWRHTMSDHYGYIKRSVGSDNEQVDVYVGPQPESDRVFVVDQLHQQDGSFDEHKVMLGYPDEASAVAAYRSNFDPDWKVGPVASLSVQQFKDWLAGGDLSKPATSSEVPPADQQQSATKAKAADDRFAGNTIFTADKVAAARALLKSKLGQLNAGFDPELATAGMTIAGGYIEVGVRNFREYAQLMVEDFGERIKPYLLGFWENVRYYPGLDTEGMTSPEESLRLHKELNSSLPAEEAAPLGTEVKAPATRAKKAGKGADRTLIQDFGVEHIDGYGDGAREVGNDTKDAFLKDATGYLKEVAKVLEKAGYMPHTDGKGRYRKAVSVNEAGPAVSGDVTLAMRTETGLNAYVSIGDSALRGVVPNTKSGIAVMYRVSRKAGDTYAAQGVNRWAPVDLTADEIATMILREANGLPPELARPALENTANESGNAEPRGNQAHSTRVHAPESGRGRDPQPAAASADTGDVAARQPENVGSSVPAETGGAAGLRPAGTDVAGDERKSPGRAAGDGRPRAGGNRPSDAGAGRSPAAESADVAGGRGSDDAEGILQAVTAAGLSTVGTPTGRKFTVALKGYEYATAVITKDGDRWAMTSRGKENAVTGTLPDVLAAAKAHMESVRSGPSSQPASPAATGVQAEDFHIDNPLEIVGGTPVQRFNRNRQALELLQTLEEEGRQANPEEQKILAGYIGWGSFGQELFQGTWDHPVYKDEGAWKERGQWLRDTLGESAWKSAQRSITNAHYTDPPTVMAMWDMVRRMGFEGGKVEEPSMGTGNFFSMMPADLKARSQLTGIELDETTGAIAKQLFPRSNVRIMGYQDSKTPDGFYDLIIGNWPFENTPVADRRYNKLNPMLHDYFFLKTVDQVRPGGIVIGITSAGSMDKQNTTIRRELARKAELVAAIRLPSGAFEEYAGTKVVTDIVILRKRPERLVAVPKDATWVETGDFQTPSGQAVRVNQYFLENPQNIIGQLDYGHGTTTFKAGMIVHRPDNMAERLKQAIELVPEKAFQPSQQADHLTYYANETGERHGALAVVNDRLMVALGDQLVLANDESKYVLKDARKTAAREQELKAAVDLRKRHSALIDAERSGKDAEQARKALREGYQAFVKQHGPLRSSFALGYLQKLDDPFYAELAALENDDGTPATVMQRSTTRSRRSIENPNVRDAYVLARNLSVNPSLEDVAKIAGKPLARVRAELIESGAVFEAPNGDIVPSDIYLSGNVRLKLREAKAALDDGNAAMARNVEALQGVVPADIPYFNIETKLGATWIPTEVYADYIAHMLSRPSPAGVEVQFRSGRWKVKLSGELNALPEAKANYGSSQVLFSRLVQAALSNQTLRLTSKDEHGNDVYDAKRSEEANASLAKIREDFATWVWSDPARRVDLEREYNESRNAWATPKYDGSFLTFEGMALTLGNGVFNLRQHQANAIWRGIVNRRSLNAHEVGTGKTFTMGGIAVESRRYGIARKPAILAHNANSATVAAEIRMMYPAARVLYIDNLDKNNRAIRLRQIANDDWDAIVIPHSLIDRLALREETLTRMAEDDISALEQEFYDAAAEDGVDVSKVDLNDDEAIAKVRSTTAKELAKARKRIIENIKKQAQQSSREDAVAFEDLGIDMLLVDEAHEFKKPPIVTRMQMKGLNTQVSDRSIALQFLTRYVRQMNNGGNVHTFTGTPITNTITEIYHQMRYVMETEMEAAGVADWDGWFGSFATEVQDVELTAAGDYEMVTRLAGFVNVPELRQMVGQYMDTVFADDMPEMQPRRTASGKTIADDLTEAERAELLNGRTEKAQDRPYKKVINESADMTPEQMAIFQDLQGYARDWRSGTGKQRREWKRRGDPRSPIITEGIANKASFDVRLIDEGLAGQEGKTQDDPSSKASRVVRNVLEIYNSHPQANQVIFGEMGFSRSVRRTRTSENGEKHTATYKVFSTIHDIVERLVQGGIPRDQIAIVDGKTSKDQRKEIAKAMNDSRIRVVLGSTDTLGVGVNMQRNLRAMHHLDAPYMPGELEQRNGRGQRQGNQWNTVLEYRYMTDRLDGRRWQILAVKQRFITAFMKADMKSQRVIEGEAAAEEQSDILESFSEAAGDPRILQRVKLQKKLEGLQRKERLYSQGIADMRRQMRYAQEDADKLNSQVERIQSEGVLGKIADLIASQQQDFTATIDGKAYDNRKDAAAALQDYVDANLRVGDKPRPVGTYGGQPLQIEWLGFSDAPTTTIKAFGQQFGGKGIAGAEAKMRNFPKSVEADIAERDAALATVENMRHAMKQPFGQAGELERVSKQLADLEKDLELNPVPPPSWLRQGAPIDSQVYRNGKPYVVVGHRYGQDNWYVIAEDDKGNTLIPYMEATDNVGMPLYEEHEFTPPQVEKSASQASAAPAPAPEAESADVRYSRAGLSPSSVVVGTPPENPITLAQAEQAAREFFAAYNGNIQLTPWIRKTQYELYGPKGTIDQIGIVKGAYHPGRGVFTLAADHLSSMGDVRETLRHEILGHYGLDTFKPEDKQALLEKILASKKVPSLEPIWTKIARLYSDKTELQQAEEVFANIAEQERSTALKIVDLLRSVLTRILRKVGLQKRGILTKSELLREVEVISKGIRNGSRTPQGSGPGPRFRTTAEALPLPEVGAEINGKQLDEFARALYRSKGTESAFFRHWFGDSKMRTKDGTPVPFYHRSFDPRERFTNARLGGKTGTATAQLGHFFATRDVGNVERYGPFVERFFIKMVKPRTLTMAQFEAMGDWSPERVRAYREHLQAQGYDGLWIKGLNWAVAFDGKSVKAVANRGTFDLTDNVRFSRSEDDGEFATTAQAYGGEQAWRAAQVAGRTKLNYQQWVQVRMPTYKAEYGNWEALRAQLRMDAMSPLKLRSPEAWSGLSKKERQAAVEALLKDFAKSGEVLQHDELGGVRVGMSGAKKSASTAADPAKLVVLSELRASFKHSIYASSALSYKHGQTTVYHKLLAPIDVDGDPLVAVFTVREDANGRMFYNTVTVGRKNEALAVSPGDMSNAQGSLPANTKASGDFVRRELDRVNPDSVTIDLDPQTGEPILADDDGFLDPGTRFRLADFTPDWIGGKAPFKLEKRNIARGLRGKLSDLKPALLGALPLSYLRDFAPKSMTALDQYLEQKRAMDADRNELHTEYDAIAQRWLKLRWTDRQAERALSDLMHAATLAGIDPSKPFGSRYNPDQRPEYDRLRAQYEALPEGHRAMFNEARDAYRGQIGLLERVIEENIRKSAEFAKRRARRDRDAAIEEARDELTGEDLDEAIETAEKRYARRVAAAENGNSAKILLLRKRFESMRVDEPYFPLKRFGDYFVALRDGNKLVSFSMFENAAAMEAAAEELRKTYPGLEVKVGRQSMKQQLAGAVDPGFVSDLQELVAEQPNAQELGDQIWQLYLDTLPDYSMRKGFIHRKKVAGFSRDALRSFASSMFHSSYQIARLKHSLEMGDLVDQMEEQAKDAADPVDAMTIANEMRQRHEWVMAPKGSKIAQRITSAAFIYQLGITPAAALVNTTQTWMMGIPILGTRFGSEAKALAALTKASADFVTGRGHIENKLEGDEAKAFAEFLRMGLIDKTQAHDLAGVGETGVEYNPLRQKVMGYISWGFHNAERYNREVTAMAAYRMARESGLSHEAAIKEAADLTWTTHFDYSSGNRARYLQNDTAKVLFVFRQYSINMLSRLVIDLKDAMKGESAQVKNAARRRLAGIFSMFALFAGVMGVPGMQTILLLLNALDDDDDEWTAEDKIKRTLAETLGPDLSRVILGGVPGAALDISLTDRLGMGNLWFYSPSRELEGQDAYYYWMEQALGAAPAMVGNAFTGMKQIGEGHVWRGLETMMPKAVKDAMRSGRYASEGVQTMAGDALVDEVTMWNVLSQAMGFTPAHITEQYDRNNALKNAEQKLLSERRRLLNRYAMATKAGDTESRQALQAKIADFNRRFPTVAITGRTFLLSMKARAQRDERTKGGLALDSRLQGLRAEL
ncbi:PLxRFG domain-containing protein [Azotobacter bryophylli]|uniref:PLxRFG domain-containing protein n=1 Tax=Azotobacter bryophylli TaxID=1986537 RepID=A0ABV7B0W8_9GAMM